MNIGILDPGKFPLTITGTGGLTPTILGLVSNLVSGVLTPDSNGLATLQLNNVLGQNLETLVGLGGSTLKICQQGSTTNCASVALTSNSSGIVLGSSLASVALEPGQSTPLSVSALPLLGGLGPFTAVSSNANVVVTPTGFGTFTVAAAAGTIVPTNATVTVTDALSHSIAIPVTVF